MNMKIPSVIAIGVIVFIAVIIGGIIWARENCSQVCGSENAGCRFSCRGFWTKQRKIIEVPDEKPTLPVGCPLIAKICPDGSSVGQTGSNCEFAECPITQKEVTADWQTYRNDKLGIEIKIPKFDSRSTNKIKVVENGNIVWIVEENGDEYKQNIEQINSPQSEYKKVSGIPWAILVKEVKNDAQLEDFIQKKYWKACKLGTKKPSPQDNVFDVTVNMGNSTILDTKGCFMNWGVVIKYSPKKKLAAIWDLGQEVYFSRDDNSSLQEEMIDSFKFTK